MLTLETIIILAGKETGRSRNEILGRSRRTEIVFARRLFTYIAVEQGYSFNKIGFFCGKDHTTIIHQYRQAENTKNIKDIYTSLNLEKSPDRVLIQNININSQRKFRHIYERFEGKCLVCSFTAVVEICHIKPRYLGGGDEPGNLLLLCPNHHSMFDRGLLFLKDIHFPTEYPQG